LTSERWLISSRNFHHFVEFIFRVKECAVLIHGDALSPLFLNFALEYALRKVQEYQKEQKLNGTHQLLAYANDLNLILPVVPRVCET
jgi:hypothetical protein